MTIKDENKKSIILKRLSKLKELQKPDPTPESIEKWYSDKINEEQSKSADSRDNMMGSYEAIRSPLLQNLQIPSRNT
jgi:hypothetical protein